MLKVASMPISCPPPPASTCDTPMRCSSRTRRCPYPRDLICPPPAPASLPAERPRVHAHECLLCEPGWQQWRCALWVRLPGQGRCQWPAHAAVLRAPFEYIQLWPRRRSLPPTAAKVRAIARLSQQGRSCRSRDICTPSWRTPLYRVAELLRRSPFWSSAYDK